MPAGSPHSTYHKKKDGWEYWSYPFSQTVLIAEKKLKWYDEDKLTDLWRELKRIGVRLCWAEASDTSHSYTKKSCRIELYKKYPKDTPFQDKIRDMETIIEQYGLKRNWIGSEISKEYCDIAEKRIGKYVEL